MNGNQILRYSNRKANRAAVAVAGLLTVKGQARYARINQDKIGKKDEKVMLNLKNKAKAKMTHSDCKMQLSRKKYSFKLCIANAVALAAILVCFVPSSTFAQSAFDGYLKNVTITDSYTSNQPPTAAFTYTINVDTITFDASGSTDTDGTISNYKWSFEDGTKYSGTNVAKTFTGQSEVNVSLQVIDNKDAISILQKRIALSTTTQTSTSPKTTYLGYPNDASEGATFPSSIPSSFYTIPASSSKTILSEAVVPGGSTVTAMHIYFKAGVSSTNNVAILYKKVATDTFYGVLGYEAFANPTTGWVKITLSNPLHFDTDTNLYYGISIGTRTSDMTIGYGPQANNNDMLMIDKYLFYSTGNLNSDVKGAGAFIMELTK